MSEVNYTKSWPEEATQCQHCQAFQIKENQQACVPPRKTFEESIAAYGEVSTTGHCNYFRAKQ